MEEHEIAIRCAEKDNTAQKELYEEYGSRILALCRRYAADPADAEDMMQDAFIKIFSTISRFRYTRPGSLYSWMARVAINLAFDSSKRRRSLARQLVDVDNLKNDISEETSYDETATVPPDVLQNMIDALPEGYRIVFKLYCIDGLSHREIADLLGIKEKSSSSSLARARAILAAAIRQYWKDQDEGRSDERWTLILSKMRHRKTMKTLTLIIALLIPATTLLLWNLPHKTDIPAVHEIFRIADNHIPVIDEDHYIIDSPADIKPVRDRHPVPAGTDSLMFIDRSDESHTFTADTTVHASDVPQDIFAVFKEEAIRTRPRLSFNVKAGSGTARRHAEVSLSSSPYIAALTFMNSVDSGRLPEAKSNYDNAIPWFYANYYAPPPASKSNSLYGNDFTLASTNSYRHHLPVTFGLSVRMDLTSRIGIESGVEYTYMHSDIETVVGNLSQNLHFIGIPLRFDTQVLSWSGLDMYLGIGGKAEKCVAASLGQVKCEEKRMQWSAGVFAGVQYQIGGNTHLYFQPEMNYSFTDTDLITYRTENPMIFSINAGFRFDL